MSSDIDIKEIIPINVENGILINGFPSTGLTSAVATESLINTTEFELGSILNNKNFSLSLVTLALSITATDINAADAYNLVEIEVTENYKHHYPEAMNSQGEIIGNAFTRYNPVIYPESYLASLGIPQEEIDANTYTNTSMNTIRNALLLGSGSLANDALVQKIADARGFVSNLASSSDDKAVLVNTVDVIDEEIDSFTFSSLEQLTGINDSGVIVGNATAPFTTSMFTIYSILFIYYRYTLLVLDWRHSWTIK